MDLRLLDAADIPREEVEEGVDDEEETGGDTNEDTGEETGEEEENVTGHKRKRGKDRIFICNPSCNCKLKIWEYHFDILEPLTSGI